MSPKPLFVIPWAIVMLAFLGTVCVWGVREDDARRWRRRPVFDCSGFVSSIRAAGVAASASAVAFSALGRSLIEVGVTVERANASMRRALNGAMRSMAFEIEERARAARPVIERGEGHIQFIDPDGVEHDLPILSMEIRGVRYDRHRDDDAFTSQPIVRQSWESQSARDAHRVAAIADEELAAWRDFIDGLNR